MLVYEIVAEPCGGGQPLAEFPAEVNFNLEYMDGDLYNVDERIVRVVWLDPQTETWVLVEKQELVPSRNAIGATITRTGRYAVYEYP